MLTQIQNAHCPHGHIINPIKCTEEKNRGHKYLEKAGSSWLLDLTQCLAVRHCHSYAKQKDASTLSCPECVQSILKVFLKCRKL